MASVRSLISLLEHSSPYLGGLEIRLIAQGTSRWSFSFVVEETDAVEAARPLHEGLLENHETAAVVAG